MDHLRTDQRPHPADTCQRVAICEREIPLAAALAADRCCLAVITAVEGPSYRPLGAAMVVDADGRRTGSLSSGCIEDDVVIHALECLQGGVSRRLRYGRGSPFMDLQLPCGGGLEITLVPAPSRPVLEAVQARLVAREGATLSITPEGALVEGACEEGFTLSIVPQLRLIVLGKGVEARTVYEIAGAMDVAAELWSPDEETRGGVRGARELVSQEGPWDFGIDARTAVALFFHDHDWEPPLLASILKSPALYIGAQGSARARATREAALVQMGVSEAEISRLVRPFGLVPHARDPRSLAAGVIAQVLDHARIS
ncbi:XdhC family protein [Celeribacter indicus]|uniref:Exported xanthine dehydrogenase/CoxI family protein n=1 Tax=Celeribacter indicus TaxID=1208324 RepID=A0A0B5E2V5_9RHOB|nr:XdhC family protein [Celeribacter indicus]AJE47361.1 exported xanthine dehydrogenase/CoxI family protein [Celeribacter indicus]SDW04530.1 xanthine dehydrogenase accessory factor [Celeribacter indicus]